jgi:hypothetical protein
MTGTTIPDDSRALYSIENSRMLQLFNWKTSTFGQKLAIALDDKQIDVLDRLFQQGAEEHTETV